MSVLVPVLNEERWLGRAVGAMLAQELDGELELLFADGGSADHSRQILTELAAEDDRIQVFDNPRRITPSGLNICLGEARGEFVARMDAHTFYPPGYLRDGIERLRRGDTSWVSGPVIPHPVGRVSRAVALALASPLGHGGANKWAADGVDDEIELDTGVFGGVWRRETLMDYGGWDEAWPQNQDAELAGRFLARGERLVCLRTMGARYVPRDNLVALWRQYYRYGFYRVATARRHPHSLRRSHLLAPALAVTVATAVGGRRWVRRGARLGVGVYGAVLAGQTARTWMRAERRADAVELPAVLAAMHLGNGVGMLAGVGRFGFPGAAVARATGIDRLAGRVAARPPGARDVAAPGRRRLAVYTDYTYRSDGARVYGGRSFVLFLTALAVHVDELVLVGRLHPEQGTSHYPLPETTRLVGLPYYETLTRPHEAVASMLRSMGRFWRLLGEVDAVWLMGPYIHSVAFVVVAALRRRRITLGVRQDLPALTRTRSNSVWLHVSADVLEAIWKLYARRLPTVAVGPELARKYAHARELLPIVVSLVSQGDVGAPPRNWDGPRLVLTVGRLEQEKNPLMVVDVVARLRASGGDWRLVMCGDGPMDTALRAHIAERGMEDHVEVRGYVPLREGLLDLYRSAHVLLHLSWSEGLPQVLFEAFASGLPVVATAVGGLPEAAADAALLIPPGRVEPATEALERLAGDPALRDRLVAAGLERVKEHTLEVEAAGVAAFVLGEGAHPEPARTRRSAW